jgi:hypothetical protein
MRIQGWLEVRAWGWKMQRAERGFVGAPHLWPSAGAAFLASLKKRGFLVAAVFLGIY